MALEQDLKYFAEQITNISELYLNRLFIFKPGARRPQAGARLVS